MYSRCLLSFCYPQSGGDSPGHHPATAPPASPAADWLLLEVDLEVSASRFLPWAGKGEQAQGLWFWGNVLPLAKPGGLEKNWPLQRALG